MPAIIAVSDYSRRTSPRPYMHFRIDMMPPRANLRPNIRYQLINPRPIPPQHAAERAQRECLDPIIQAHQVVFPYLFLVLVGHPVVERQPYDLLSYLGEAGLLEHLSCLRVVCYGFVGVLGRLVEQVDPVVEC